MKVISTVHKAGFDLYGQKWLDGIKHWPDAEWHLYTEGFDLVHPVVNGHRIDQDPRRNEFMDRYSYYKPVAWRWDIRKWANKVFASYAALRDYTGLAVWLDCDVETYAPFPEGYVENLLPKGCYLAAFKRTGMCTETGFWVMDCSHEQHGAFMDTWMAWLESGQFKTLDQWCDASTMDATVRKFEARKLIETVSLSTPHEKKMNPMAFAHLARYVDHRKGDTKDDPQAITEENIFRKAA